MTGVAILLAAAAVAYALARWLDVPAIPFLLLAGIGLSAMDVFPVALMQDAIVLGLTFLLFIAGIELNPRRIREQRRTVLRVGLLQFGVMGSLGAAAAVLLGTALLTAVYVGLALAASSTLVVVRLLQRRRQLYEPFGRLVVGVLLLQDILVILLIPVLTHAPAGPLRVVGGVAGTLALMGLAWLCLRWVAPLLVRLRTEPEILLLAVLTVLSVFIALAHLLALPLAAGAFLAGIGLSPFPIRGILRGQLGPVGDFFSAIFFVALGGMLQPPGPGVLLHAAIYAAVLLLVTPPLVAAVAERAAFPARRAVEAALLLSQTSELSLVLALQGLLLGHLSQDVFTSLALVTVATMMATPTLSSERVVQKLMRLQPVRARPLTGEPPHGHVLLLGCGAGGMPLLETLFAAGHEVVVIDDDPEVIERLRRGDVRAIRGDAAEAAALAEANAAGAIIISSTIRRPRDNGPLLEHARDRTVLVRVFEDDDAEWVRRRGGLPVVYSEAAAEEFINWFDRVFTGALEERRESGAVARGPR